MASQTGSYPNFRASQIRESLDLRQYWLIEAVLCGQRRYIGRCFATAREMKLACGPWVSIEGNLITIFSPPVA